MTKIILFSLLIFFLSSCNNDQSAPNIKDDYTIHFDTLSRLNDGVCKRPKAFQLYKTLQILALISITSTYILSNSRPNYTNSELKLTITPVQSILENNNLKNKPYKLLQFDSLRQVSGLIKGESQQLLIGCTVLITNSKNSVISGIDGQFTIDITNELKTKDSIILLIAQTGFKQLEKIICRSDFSEKEQLFFNITLKNGPILDYLEIKNKRPSFFKKIWKGIKNIFT
jgi:hypothetical protein